MKKFINYLIIIYYWSVVTKCKQLIDDPKSKFSTKLTDNLTMDEMAGVSDVEKISRLLEGKPLENIKDFKHLRECLSGR